MSTILIIYLLQHLNIIQRMRYEIKIEQFLSQVNQVIQLDHKCAHRYISIYIIIVISTNFLHEFSLYTRHIEEVNNIFLTINYVLQSIIPTLLTDYYCGCLLVSSYYFRQINKHLTIVIYQLIVLTKHIQARRYDKRKYQFMQEFCNISDRIDEIAQTHRKLCEMTIEYNRLWSKLTLIYFIWKFYLLVTQLYINFILIKLAVKFWHFDMIAVVVGSFLLFSHAFSLVKIAYCSQKIMNEVIMNF